MKPGTTLYFIRHGETGWNKTQRIQGQIDSELNATGRQQAARNGQALGSMGLDLTTLDCVASPLWRTSETMEIVRENAGLPRSGYRTDPVLKEIHFGVWQGAYWGEIATVDPAGHAARTADPFTWRPNQGESYEDLMARCGAWFDGLDRDTLCVSHGGVSRVLRGHVDRTIPPADVTELEVPQDRILVFRYEGDRIGYQWV